MKNACSIFVLFLLCSMATVEAQESFWSRHPIVISLFTHSISTPFKKVLKHPFNFGCSIGTEFNYRMNRASTLHQEMSVGTYFHKNLGAALFLKSNFHYRYTTKTGFQGEASLALGYHHSFAATPIFELQPSGTYQQVKDRGQGAFLFGFGLGAAYNTSASRQVGHSPFLRYEYLLETPYSDDTSIFPHALLHLGSRIYPKL